jgi:GxxExxY protein
MYYLLLLLLLIATLGCKRFSQIFADEPQIFADMNENEISFLIRGAAFKVFNSLGPGLLESVYEKALSYELKLLGLDIQNQVGIPMRYKEVTFDVGFRLDILINDLVIVEIKSVDALMDIHHKQLLTYLKLMNKKLGLLINFNALSLNKSSMVRIANNL